MSGVSVPKQMTRHGKVPCATVSGMRARGWVFHDGEWWSGTNDGELALAAILTGRRVLCMTGGSKKGADGARMSTHHGWRFTARIHDGHTAFTPRQKHAIRIAEEHGVDFNKPGWRREFASLLGVSAHTLNYYSDAVRIYRQMRGAT